MGKHDFGYALEGVKSGMNMRRRGWNGKGMYVFLIGVDRETPAGIWDFTNGKNDNMTRLPFIAMKTATDEIVPWLASQTDLLAEDWEVAE